MKDPPLLSPLRTIPCLSQVLPSAPMGGSWQLGAGTRRRGCGTCPLACCPHCSRCVRWGGDCTPPSPPSTLIAGVHRRCLSNFREGGDPCAVHLTTDLEATLLATDRTEEWYNGALCILKYRPLLASSPRSGPLQRRLQHRLQSRWAAAGHWQHGQDGEGVGLVLHQTCSIA